MPEILEVECYRCLAEGALGRPIATAWMVDGRYGRGGATPQRVRAALAGRTFSAARRRGKLLLLDTAEGPTLGVRFGMTGGLVLDGRQALDRLRYGPGVFDRRWVRARVTFGDGGELVLHDPRRFGSLELAPDEHRLGPDALEVTEKQLADALQLAGVPRATTTGSSRAAPLKARLMDQERLAGIGNLLADEILWRAGLDPRRRSPLGAGERRRLHRALRSTLRLLGRRGGSHTGDLMGERGPGGRCPRDGAELAHGTVGGRGTYWCPEHQR